MSSPSSVSEQDGAAVGVVDQNGGAVAAVIGLALQGLPLSVAPAVVEGGAAQHVPAVGGDLDITDDHVGVAGQVSSSLVEADPAAAIGVIDTALHAAPGHGLGAW
jgi:hypothetical protein